VCFFWSKMVFWGVFDRKIGVFGPENGVFDGKIGDFMSKKVFLSYFEGLFYI
jgi:hypothetical protein